MNGIDFHNEGKPTQRNVRAGGSARGRELQGMVRLRRLGQQRSSGNVANDIAGGKYDMSKALNGVDNDIGDTADPKKNTGHAMLPSLRSKIAVTDFVMPGLRGACWSWAGAHDRNGYARVRIGRRVGYVRREMLKCEGVDLADDDQVVSPCRMHGCVNPDHHVVGADEDVRAFGGKWSRIGVGDLIFAKELIDSGKASIDFIAFAYQVSERVISQGIRRCC